jgi:hypothetical protein
MARRSKFSESCSVVYLRLTRNEIAVARERAEAASIPVSTFIRQQYLRAIADGDAR